MDVTFTTDSSGNPLMASDSKETSQILYQLFHMKKGDNHSNMEAGLDLMSKKYCLETDLLDYPAEIVDQISKYTDYTASDVSAKVISGSVVISFSLMTKSGMYTVVTGIEDNSLKLLLEKQV